jgi:hypothetical protein
MMVVAYSTDRVRNVFSLIEDGTISVAQFQNEMKTLNLAELRQLGRAIVREPKFARSFAELVRAELDARGT